MLTGRVRQALGSDELKFFLLAVVLAVVIVFGNILPMYDTAGHAMRDAWFQVASIVSTTGFATTDFALWPVLPQLILLLLMFLGGCAGSTAGGIKASRILLMLRCAHRSLRRLIHPRSVKVVKLDGKPVDEDTLNTVFVFFLCFMGVLGLACLVVCLDGFSLTTSFTATLACLSNTGPGLEAVGPMGNFSAFSALSKWVLSAAMLIGRLEIFPILILLLPSTGGRIECRPPPADSCESAGFFLLLQRPFGLFVNFLEKEKKSPILLKIVRRMLKLVCYSIGALPFPGNAEKKRSVVRGKVSMDRLHRRCPGAVVCRHPTQESHVLLRRQRHDAEDCEVHP